MGSVADCTRNSFATLGRKMIMRRPEIGVDNFEHRTHRLQHREAQWRAGPNPLAVPLAIPGENRTPWWKVSSN